MNYLKLRLPKTLLVLVLLNSQLAGTHAAAKETAFEVKSSEISPGGGGGGVGKLQPQGTTEYYRVAVEISNTRRMLAPFQLCLVCKCCVAATDPTTCATMPCCFGIDCQLPNKPFGVCAFVPKTCNCTSCAVV